MNSSGISQAKHVIAVAAGKGGVGKSALAVNLALALKKKGKSVGLMDADVYGPSLVHMLPRGILPTQCGEHPDEILPAETLGIKMISTAHFRGGSDAALVRAPIANSIISQFISQVQWGELDYLLMDFPPGTGDVQLTLLQQAFISAAVIVTTPQEVALLDVRKAVQMFHEMGVPILGVVENMSHFIHPQTQEKFYPFGKGGGMKLSQEFHLPFLGEVPLDPTISACGDQGISIFDHFSDSFGALSLQKIAANMLELEIGEGIKKFELVWKNEAGDNRCEFLQESFGQGVYKIQSIFQEDAHTFGLKWVDGLISKYRLSILQQNCPCIRCKESRERPLDCLNHKCEVQAHRIYSSGSYALRIDFTSGCSRGIYSLSALREMR